MDTKNLAQIYKLIRKHNESSRALGKLKDFRTDDRKALDAFTSLQASIAVLVTAESDRASVEDFQLNSLAGNMKDRVRSLGAASSNEILKVACSLICEWPEDLERELNGYVPFGIRDSLSAVQAFFQEGMGRDGAYATPKDISKLISITAGSPGQLDVYAIGGIGLYLSLVQLMNQSSIRLAWGHEFKTANSNTYDGFNFSIQAIFETAYASLIEKLMPQRQGIGDALLINAANNPNPIIGDPSVYGRLSSELNHVVGSINYKIRALLVPNSMLSAGHGPYKSQLVFSELLNIGLTTIREFQNALARKDEKFSILLFGTQRPPAGVLFQVLLPSKLNNNEVNRFGKIRRAQVLKVDFAKHLAPPNLVEACPTLDELLGPKPKKSFEPGRIVPIPLDLPNQLLTEDLEKVCDEDQGIHRFQHIEQDPTETYRSYMELGAADIDEYGQIDISDPSRERRYYDKDEVASVQQNALEIGDIILCVKGSIGKVALIEELPKGSNGLMVANQSFVRLRLKKSKIQEGLVPQILFWWLRSKYAQDYLKSKVVAAGVPRIPTIDIETMQIPIGPRSFMEDQAKTYSAWKELVNLQRSSAEQARNIQTSSWR